MGQAVIWVNRYFDNSSIGIKYMQTQNCKLFLKVLSAYSFEKHITYLHT